MKLLDMTMNVMGLTGENFVMTSLKKMESEIMNTDTTPREIIVSTLNHLREINYRNGYYKTVFDKVMDALNEYDPNVARKFYNLKLTGCNTPLVEDLLDGDWSVLDLYEQVFEEANGPGSFQMPDWGTRGT